MLTILKPKQASPPQSPVIPEKTSERTLVIWTTDKAQRVWAALNSVTKFHPDAKISVNNDLSKMPAGDVVFVLGKEATEVLAAIKVIPKNRGLGSLRTELFKIGKQDVMFSYSVGIKEVDYAMYVDLVCDFAIALRVLKTGKITSDVGKYEWVEDFEKLIAEVKAEFAITGKPVDVAFDSETSKDVYDKESRFVTLQFSNKLNHAFVLFVENLEHHAKICTGVFREQLKWLFTTPMISLRMASGKYDMIWVAVHTAIVCTNYKFDTTLVGSLLDENRSNSIDVHAKQYTNIGGYSDDFDRLIDKEKMADLPKDADLLNYAGGDTDACRQAAEKMKKELLADKKLTQLYVNIVHPASRAFEVIERGGIFVDKDAYDKLESDLRTNMEALAKKAINIIGGRIFAKHKDDTKVGGINLTKASMLKDFLFDPHLGLGLKPKIFTEKSGEPSTAYDHLMMFKDDPKAGEFVSLIDDYSGCSKTLSTYVIGFKEHLRQDGRFHPWYFLFKGKEFLGADKDRGTVTGRLSAIRPAFQTVPKHTKWGKLLRKIFCAPPGYVVLERDYSQGELRVVACMSCDPVMLQAYKEGKDLHVVTGAKIAGFTYEQVMAMELTDPAKFDSIRQPAKPANFGLLYGQGWEGFQAYAFANYGVLLTDAEAKHIHKEFFELYRMLPVYHQQYKAFAHKHGYVASPLGRIRHLPLIHSAIRMVKGEAERMAINAPVQATLTDLMIWALALEWQQGGFEVAPCFGVVHDAAYDYVPEDNVIQIVERKRDLMENLPFEKVGWTPQLKFIADCKIGPNMGDLKKVKKAA